MNSLSTLVLLTASYPYGEGEAFLETELPVLAAAFDRVIILPSHVAGIPRHTPANATVDASASFPRDPGRLAAAALRVAKEPWVWREIGRSLPISIHPRAASRTILAAREAIGVSRWLRRNAPADTGRLLVYSYWLNGQAVGALRARSSRSFKVVARAHRYDLYRDEHSPPYIPFQDGMLTELDSVYPVSEHGAAYLRSLGCKAPIVTSRLGVQDPGFTTPPSSDGVLRLVSCSFVHPVKRLELIVRSLALWGQRNSDRKAEWMHLGGGEQLSSLKALARRELPSNIRASFAGTVSNAAVLAYYAQNAVDVFLNVSSSEGVPVSIMEAQSCGIPVIATAVGGTPEIVSDRCGVLLSPNPTPDNVASAIERIAASPAVAVMRAESRNVWRRRYNADVNYREFAAMLLGHLEAPVPPV